MKTDRELLEGAAKAAGYGVEWRNWITSRIAAFGAVRHTKHEGFWLNGGQWNPLTDDGDALWLSVDLQIDLSHRFAGDQRIEAKTPCGHVMTEYCNTETRQEATRRAIVRAAYEIGVKP